MSDSITAIYTVSIELESKRRVGEFDHLVPGFVGRGGTQLLIAPNGKIFCGPKNDLLTRRGSSSLTVGERGLHGSPSLEIILETLSSFFFPTLFFFCRKNVGAHRNSINPFFY